MLADKENPLQFELVKSFEEFKTSSKLNTYKGNILHVFTPEKEVVLIDWLMSPRETRLQFENLGNLLNIPRNHLKLLKLLIFNILWSLPESPLSHQLHALYCPSIRQNLSYYY